MTDNDSLRAQRVWATAQAALDEYVQEVMPPATEPLTAQSTIPQLPLTREQLARFDELYVEVVARWAEYRESRTF